MVYYVALPLYSCRRRRLGAGRSDRVSARRRRDPACPSHVLRQGSYRRRRFLAQRRSEPRRVRGRRDPEDLRAGAGGPHGISDGVIRRKGELSPAGIDNGWPNQVALPASASAGGGYKIIHAFCKDLSLCLRSHSVVHEGEWFNVCCFAEPGDAEKFMQRFGGEKFDPRQRGRGSNWARWKK